MNSNKTGVSFVLPGDYGKYLFDLFSGIHPERFSWYIEDKEVLSYNSYNEEIDTELFKRGIYSGIEFSEIISQNSCYIVLARIFAVPNGLAFNPEDIKTYNDYLSSNCELAFLCADGFVDFYSKDMNIIETVADTCRLTLKNEYSFITDESDSRTSFLV